MQIQSQEVLGGACGSAFVTSPRLMLMPLVYWIHFGTEGLDDVDKVIQESLLIDESGGSVSQMRKPRRRGRWPQVSTHIWEASTLIHNCYLSC